MKKNPIQRYEFWPNPQLIIKSSLIVLLLGGIQVYANPLIKNDNKKHGAVVVRVTGKITGENGGSPFWCNCKC